MSIASQKTKKNKPYVEIISPAPIFSKMNPPPPPPPPFFKVGLFFLILKLTQQGGCVYITHI